MSTLPPARSPGGGQLSLEETIARLQRLADHVVPLTVRAIAQAGIADLLKDGPRPVEELAAASGTHAPSLCRALRALAASGIFTEVDRGCFGLTPMAQLLRSDHPLSMRDLYPLMDADLLAWAHVDHTIATGEAAFPHVHGQQYYDFLATHPEHAARFDRAVETQARLVLRTLLGVYDWARCGTIVDVAAGTGVFLAGLLRRYRQLRGVVFDLPHVVARAPAVLAAAGVTERCAVVAGSFFDAVPAGGDTYLLKTILHDWDDEHALRILRAIHRSMAPGSRLLVLEALLPPGDEFHPGKLIDLHSLVLVRGEERDRDQLARLVTSGGFEVVAVTTTNHLSVLEARPATA